MVVSDVDLDVQPGEIVALLGANGAGKTSTLETIEGFLPPAGGRVTLLGHPPAEAVASGQVGVVLQDGGFAPGARVGETMRLFRQLHGDVGPTVDELVSLCGLTEVVDATVRRLSGGEHRRLALAVALVGEPDLLLLDEPTAGVDQSGRRAVIDTIAARRDAGTGILLTTHELDVVEELADRVVVLHGGAVAVATTMDALDDLAPARVRVQITPMPDAADLADALDREVSVDGAWLVIAGDASNALTAAVAQWCDEHGRQLGAIETGRRLADVLAHLDEAER